MRPMENPSFFLEGVVREKDEMQDFEGPLSLILTLLSKNKIEIRDVSISQILDQYLAYLEEMQSMDLEIASEFVQMASHLLYIKTRTLLSGEEEITEMELLRQSLEQLKCKGVYEAIQLLTPELKKASQIGLLYYAKLPEPLKKSARDYEYRHEPVDLLHALFQIYSRGGRTPERETATQVVVPRRIVYSVRDKSRQILSRLRQGKVELSSLYGDCSSRSEVVATFVSILELCSLGSVHIEKQQDGYQVEFIGGDVDEILERIEE